MDKPGSETKQTNLMTEHTEFPDIVAPASDIRDNPPEYPKMASQVSDNMNDAHAMDGGTIEAEAIEHRQSRMRSILGKARNVMGNAIGSVVHGAKEFFRPTPRKGIVIGGLATAAATGVAIKKVRSHS